MIIFLTIFFSESSDKLRIESSHPLVGMARWKTDIKLTLNIGMALLVLQMILVEMLLIS